MPARALLYLLFFVSGAAALVYEVVWARLLRLVFGGSHLAVSTVLAVFMSGLALGSWSFGRRADRSPTPLRLYGWLEIGIGLSSLASAEALRLYAAASDPLARWAESGGVVSLTLLRVGVAFVVLIVPTTLIGGTLPVLSRVVGGAGPRVERSLASLYATNTFGAVLGTLAAGFLLLPALGVSRTLWVAILSNVAVGVVSLVLARSARPSVAERSSPLGATSLAQRLVLLGIGISGFCALGYEVLWTRVLSLVTGTSVYSFAIMLAAFLAGSAAGSQAGRAATARLSLRAFGGIEIAIGIAALTATLALRALPTHAMRLEDMLAPVGSEFLARQLVASALAFTVMAVPAFLLGLAFPLACAIRVRDQGRIGEAVGAVLAANTIGAILGASASGFALVFLFGIERSIELLVAVQVGLGATLLAAASPGQRGRTGAALAALGTLGLVAGVALAPDSLRMWDRQLFAVYRNNLREAFATPERTREAVAHTAVLSYHEGIDETISVIEPERAARAFVVNGRIEASTQPEDVQCQRTLGHLPLLAHPRPRRVFVLGLGTGMTAGAAALHPEVESITLAEIEPGVFAAARRFEEFNHHVLDDRRLRVVHDDGRNFLRTTRERFDVVTADPIHPWSAGAAYLYTREYFATTAHHLTPGGVICQWLPIYELSLGDVRSVVATFAAHFRYTAIWLTYYDAEILASQEPLLLDEAALERRLGASPAIAADLRAVGMGSARQLLSYFLMGDAGVRAFAAGGRINTDDNLWLEFSAPRSQGVASRAPENVAALASFRESPLGYTAPLADPAADTERRAYWGRIDRSARLRDRAHVLALEGRSVDAELDALLGQLSRDHPEDAPARFLAARREATLVQVPRALASRRFAVRDESGRPATLEIAAVAMRVGSGRGVLVFADSERREIYGERYLDAPEEEIDARLSALADEVLEALGVAYLGEPAHDRSAIAARLRAEVARRLAEPAADHGASVSKEAQSR
jgi:spermidine synthase